jgi:hypothetical protein
LRSEKPRPYFAVKSCDSRARVVPLRTFRPNVIADALQQGPFAVAGKLDQRLDNPSEQLVPAKGVLVEILVDLMDVTQPANVGPRSDR